MPPPTLLTQDRTEPVKGFKAVMVKTMTASGKLKLDLLDITKSSIVEMMYDANTFSTVPLQRIVT